MARSVVTLDDIYKVVNRLEDKMDGRMKDIEGDVENLKGFQNKALGVISIVSVVASAIFSWIWGKLTKQL